MRIGSQLRFIRIDPLQISFFAQRSFGRSCLSTFDYIRYDKENFLCSKQTAHHAISKICVRHAKLHYFSVYIACVSYSVNPSDYSVQLCRDAQLVPSQSFMKKIGRLENSLVFHKMSGHMSSIELGK